MRCAAVGGRDWLANAVANSLDDAANILPNVIGPVTPDGGLRGRAIGYAGTQQSFVDLVEQETEGGFASLDFGIGDATPVSVGGIGEREETVNFRGFRRSATAT